MNEPPSPFDAWQKQSGKKRKTSEEQLAKRRQKRETEEQERAAQQHEALKQGIEEESARKEAQKAWTQEEQSRSCEIIAQKRADALQRTHEEERKVYEEKLQKEHAAYMEALHERQARQRRCEILDERAKAEEDAKRKARQTAQSALIELHRNEQALSDTLERETRERYAKAKSDLTQKRQQVQNTERGTIQETEQWKLKETTILKKQPQTPVTQKRIQDIEREALRKKSDAQKNARETEKRLAEEEKDRTRATGLDHDQRKLEITQEVAKKKQTIEAEQSRAEAAAEASTRSEQELDVKAEKNAQMYEKFIHKKPPTA